MAPLQFCVEGLKPGSCISQGYAFPSLSQVEVCDKRIHEIYDGEEMHCGSSARHIYPLNFIHEPTFKATSSWLSFMRPCAAAKPHIDTHVTMSWFPCVPEYAIAFIFNSMYGAGKISHQSDYCFCESPRFCSQHPHDGLQPLLTPMPGCLMPSSGLFSGSCMHTAHINSDRT